MIAMFLPGRKVMVTWGCRWATLEAFWLSRPIEVERGPPSRAGAADQKRSSFAAFADVSWSLAMNRILCLLERLLLLKVKSLQILLTHIPMSSRYTSRVMPAGPRCH